VSRRPTGAAPVLACAVLACAVLACAMLACAGLMAGCGSQPPGAAGVFTDAGGTWRSAGLVLPGPSENGRVRVLALTAVPGGNAALLAAGNSLLAAWWNGTRWTVSAPTAGGALRALGFGPDGAAWLLLGGGRAEVIGGPGSSWRALPLAPPGTGTLAAGGGGSYDGLAVAGSRLTVWRLARGAWAKVQQITVPVQPGSSG